MRACVADAYCLEAAVFYRSLVCCDSAARSGSIWGAQLQEAPSFAKLCTPAGQHLLYTRALKQSGLVEVLVQRDRAFTALCAVRRSRVVLTPQHVQWHSLCPASLPASGLQRVYMEPLHHSVSA